MKKSDWILLFLIASTFVVAFIVYPHMPDRVPVHWNTQGEIDRYGGRFEGTFLMPIISLGLFIMFKFLPRFDPKKKNYQGFSQTYGIIQWAIQLFFIIIYFITLSQVLIPENNMPSYLNISFIVPFLVSILFIIIGNYMGKVQDNFFVGIKTPWTLSSKDVWYKTHRLASKLFVIAGILGIIGAFLGGIWTTILLLIPILFAAFVPMIYSYFLYQKEIKK